MGLLAATKNDANVLLTILQGLTENQHFPGLTCAGLVRRKDALLSVIGLPMWNRSSVLGFGQDASLGMEGPVLYDTRLQGVIVRKGVVMGGGISVKDGTPTVESHTVMIGGQVELTPFACTPERLYRPCSRSETATEYGFVYYSGHGAANGDIQVEANGSVSPEEIHALSKEAGLPLIIVLDMCHADRFGTRYRELLESEHWHGLVLCANREGVSNGSAFEDAQMTSVRRPLGTVGILPSDHDAGRGVYTTALSLALMKLYDWDCGLSSPASCTIGDFNDGLLIPICAWLSRRFRVPLQVPTVHGA